MICSQISSNCIIKTTETEIHYIGYGTFFGECLGYCKQEMKLDRNVFRPELEDALAINFKLARSAVARLDAYDVTGYHITRIAEDYFPGGWNVYLWNGLLEDGRKAGSGVYIITLRSDDYKTYKKVIIVR